MDFLTRLNADKNEVWILAKQFVKFGIVGLSNTFISLGIYYVLIYFGINYIIANTVGFIISVLNSYYWNSKYVFKKSDKGNLKPLIKTFMSYGVTFLLGTTLLFVMVHYLHVSKVLAPILNLVISIPVNFLLNKFWAFK